MIETIQSFIHIALQLTVLFVVVSFALYFIQSRIPYAKVERWLKRTSPVKASFLAVLFAFITPFCSCSTIPFIVNLLKNHVRFGVVMVFLFASPILDPTILTVMAVIMGWKVTLIYTFVTVTFSIVMGLTLEKLGFASSLKQVVLEGFDPEAERHFSLKGALRETWNMMKTVYPYLLIGAAIGAVIHGLVPAHFIASHLGGDAWWLIPAAAIIGIPLYIRLSSMVPVSQVLISSGMATGPVMAMLISSAGASLPEIVLLKSIFKKQLIFAFVVSVLTMSTLSGFIFYFV
ncbi:permease [Alteribacter keqinensis]|uniref:Permease n=1 Tax=Alteribacter keqinensis TaxID=2483800 RepID=A0A3M7TSX6_9BACI|nr:permease [Alteribacter keqinensis]RNA68617.1 permease [Alteribacter keqinensis]